MKKIKKENKIIIKKEHTLKGITTDHSYEDNSSVNFLQHRLFLICVKLTAEAKYDSHFDAWS